MSQVSIITTSLNYWVYSKDEEVEAQRDRGIDWDPFSHS